MAYPDQVLGEILSRVDVVELIGRVVPLRRTGRQLKGLCPFHAEKTPSFQVSPQKQEFYCFGCGAGGNAFHFLMKREGLGFREAVQALADQVGVVLPQRETAEEHDRTRRLYEAHEMAAQFYGSMLRHPTTGDAALDYAKRRGLSAETMSQFQIGYAPDQWDSFVQHAKGRGWAMGVLEQAGLALPKRELDGHYDRFRHRLMFPISDLRGRVIGFGGRVMDDGVPKYLNSPDTPIYQKGRQLYGLPLAKEAIRQTGVCVIVEGYLDVVIPFQAGVRNVIATLGTALTDEQVRLIKRFTERVVILYDADRAGEEATLRSLDIFLAHDCHVRVAQLPAGRDPDEIVLADGPQAFARHVDCALELFDYKLRLLERRFGLQSIEGKVRVIDGMLESLSHMRNPVMQSERVKHLAETLQVDESAVRAQLRRVRRSSREWPAGSGLLERLKQRLDPQARTERYLLGLVLDNPTLFDALRAAIPLEGFRDGAVRQILEQRATAGREAWTPADWIRQAGDAEAALLAESLAEVEQFEDRPKSFQDCVAWMQRRQAVERRSALQAEIVKAQAERDDPALLRLTREFNALVRMGVTRAGE